MPQEDFKIILTADETLMAEYKLLFDGMLAGSQTTIPLWRFVSPLLVPHRRTNTVTARIAPLGLRRIEAALLDGGFSASDVAVVHPSRLADAVGPATRIVAVSAGEPLGIGMNSTTIPQITGGQILPARLFQTLLARVRSLISQRCPEARVIVGGPGAWQLAGDPDNRAKFGIQHIIQGYAEGNVAEVFRRICERDEPAEVIDGEGVDAAAIPAIRAASTMGVIEISRGCGLGCDFCTLAHHKMLHLPAETIIADAKTNLSAGVRDIAILSEDFFRYGANGTDTQPARLLELLQRLRQIDALRLVQVDHGNVLSVSQYSDDELAAARSLIVGDTGLRYPWVNIGVESASERLLLENGCRAKIGKLAGNWPDASAQQIRRLSQAGFFPLVSLILGLPCEKEDDVQQTLAWVRSVRDLPVAVFPMFYAPLDPQPGSTNPAATRLHWQLIREAYRLNFRWVPRMYWDNQKAAGVGFARRMMMQSLGCTQALLWRSIFACRCVITQ